MEVEKAAATTICDVRVAAVAQHSSSEEELGFGQLQREAETTTAGTRPITTTQTIKTLLLSKKEQEEEGKDVEDDPEEIKKDEE